jgi:competence ComEA-like helix-hairpin-helix protein
VQRRRAAADISRTSMPRREVSAPALVVLVALAILPWDSCAERPHALPCVRAIEIDGELYCDDEAPRTIGDVCGSLHPDAGAPMHGGDAIDRFALCLARAPVDRMAPDDLAGLAQPVDINHADAAELEGLPGIGPSLAARVIAARPFATVDDLAEVRGIGPATLDRLRPHVVAR